MPGTPCSGKAMGAQQRIGAPIALLLQWAKAAEAFMNNVD